MQIKITKLTRVGAWVRHGHKCSRKSQLAGHMPTLANWQPRKYCKVCSLGGYTRGTQSAYVLRKEFKWKSRKAMAQQPVLPFSQLWGCSLHSARGSFGGFGSLGGHTWPCTRCSPKASSAARCPPAPSALTGTWSLPCCLCCCCDCGSGAPRDCCVCCVRAKPLEQRSDGY